MYPHNRGSVRTMEDAVTYHKPKLVGPRTSSFKSHLERDAANNVRHTETANLIDL